MTDTIRTQMNESRGSRRWMEEEEGWICRCGCGRDGCGWSEVEGSIGSRDGAGEWRKARGLVGGWGRCESETAGQAPHVSTAGPQAPSQQSAMGESSNHQLPSPSSVVHTVHPSREILDPFKRRPQEQSTSCLGIRGRGEGGGGCGSLVSIFHCFT